MVKSFLAFATALISMTTNHSLAAAITEPLYCTIQEFTSISVATNTTDSVTVEKIDPEKPIKVTYKPLPNRKQVIEVYGVGSELQKTSLFNMGYSAGGTQYLSQDNADHAITYFGTNKDNYHIVVRYMRMQRNDGGATRGWRTDSYFNAFMYCADSRKLAPASE